MEYEWKHSLSNFYCVLRCACGEGLGTRLIHELTRNGAGRGKPGTKSAYVFRARALYYDLCTIADKQQTTRTPPTDLLACNQHPSAGLVSCIVYVHVYI